MVKFIKLACISVNEQELTLQLTILEDILEKVLSR